MHAAVALSHQGNSRHDLCLAVLACLALYGSASVAVAQPATVVAFQGQQSYALEAAPLEQSLKAIADKSGRKIAFDRRLVDGLRASAVKGQLTALEAVTMALSSTGLVVSESADGAMQIGGQIPERIVVTARRDRAETSFKADRSETATRNGESLLDVPASVSLVTSKVLETQQATSVDDALRNVSGVVLRKNGQGLSDFQIRGFTQTSTLVNGTTSPFAAQFDVFGVERVEVLKGPQAILSGGDSLGGAVNIVSKKPQVESAAELVLQYGSFGDKTIAGDVGGTLGQDNRLSYRVIGSLAKATRSDAGFDGREHHALMPQLRWKDSDTDFILGASFDKQHTPPNRYTFALDGIQPEPPMLMGNKRDGFDVETKRLFYSLEHKLTPWAKLVSRAQRSLDTIDQRVYGVQFPTSNTSFGMVPTNDVTDFNTLSGDHYLRLTFDTGPLSHSLSAGLNHTKQTFGRKSYFGDLEFVDAYAGVQHDFPPLTHDQLTGTNEASSRQRGLFVQDLIAFGDFNLLLSARNTKYVDGGGTTTFISNRTTTTTTAGKDLSKTTPGVGVVYKLRPDVSLYASYSEGFLPQFNTSKNCDGGSFDPMQTQNKEFGAKFDLLDSRLAVTAGVFELLQSNRLEFIAAGRCLRQRDAARVRGVEFDVQGELAKGWNLILQYTYNQQRDVEKPTAVEAAQPKNAISMWTTYEFQQAMLKGWGAGLGLSARSKTLSDYNASAVSIPGSAVVDASAFYRVGRWSATLGIKNLFDREVHDYTTSPLYVPIQAGRTAMFTLRTSFN